MSRLVALLLAVLTLLVYARACGNGFVNIDDPDFVSDNPMVQAGLSGTTVAWAFTTWRAGYWQPLTWLSLLLDTTVFGFVPWGYHLTNVLLHTANTVLLYLVLRRLTGDLWRSAFVAALFALHPMHVESVAWVTERKDVLSTFFWIVTMAGYSAYVARPSWGRYLLVVVPFALGLLAKPMLVTLPCALLLLDYWPLGRLRGWRDLGRLIVEKLPLFALAFGVSVVTMQAQRTAMVPLAVLPLESRFATALAGYVRYLAGTVWPLNLSAFYPYAHYRPVQVLGSFLLVAAVTALALWQFKRLPYLAVGWFWFLGTLVPVIGLFQAGNQALADRFSYVPHIGLFVACVWGAADLLERWRCPRVLESALAAAVLLGLAVGTWVQLGYWHDSRTLWEHAIEVDAGNSFAHDYLGIYLFHQKELAGASACFARAAALNDRNENAHFHLAMVCLERNDLATAEQHLKRFLELRPGDAEALDLLSKVRSRQRY